MRIIAGIHKGRTLLAPKAGTRPITGLAKSALFNILAAAVDGAAVVDLFCGAGSIGLEALSRGARLCCFAERDPDAVRLLLRNIESLGAAAQCRVWRGDVMHRLRGWLAELAEPVDLAFADPPYRLPRTWRWCEAVESLFAPLGESLAAGGQVVFRCHGKTEVPPALGNLNVRERREYGSMSLIFLSRAE
jgi:16S rRNA (guanine966-N2)-methyltransferase